VGCCCSSAPPDLVFSFRNMPLSLEGSGGFSSRPSSCWLMHTLGARTCASRNHGVCYHFRPPSCAQGRSVLSHLFLTFSLLPAGHGRLLIQPGCCKQGKPVLRWARLRGGVVRVAQDQVSVPNLTHGRPNEAVRRAPSYTPGNSAFQDEDDISLINDRKSSKSGLGATERVVRVVSQTPTAASNRQKRRRLQGWRFGVACSATMASSVLILNLILAIVAAVKFGSENGVGTAFTGSCATVNSWATWLHIVINALSSLLLSASNYTMQCLCSPTRKEIDKAHAKGDWMDVGVVRLHPRS